MEVKELLSQILDDMAMEQWVVSMYHDSLRRVKDRKAKEVFSKMAEASAEHYLELMKQADKIMLESVPEGRLEANDALRIAQKGRLEEITMQNKYSSLAKKTKNPKLKAMLENLSREEKSHKEKVEALIKHLKKSKW